MKYKIKTISKGLLADLQTPVSVYLKLRDVYPQSALLESSDFHSNENPYSFICIDPIARFKVEKGIASQQYLTNKETSTPIKDTPVAKLLDEFVKQFELTENDNPTGMNGLFGYSSYDAVQYFEDINTLKQDTPSTTIPEMIYLFYRFIITINHYKNELYVVENIPEGETSKMDQVIALIENRDFASYNFLAQGNEQSSITDDEYMQMVSKGIEHCKNGDVLQIVLSRCFTQSFTGDDFKVYRALRSINPSPYLFYFDFGSFRIFGSSPETHCGITGNIAHINPIAGTFKRSGNDDKDKELAKALLEDPKENTEHVMLVDLAIADLSKNSNNVKLDYYKNVQYYSHVIHLVSRVEATLNEGVNTLKVFADTFPAGTLSGAPKVRAMELIRDIEKHDRGAYGGCIGYLGLNGDVNQAITIRSFISRNNVLYYQAGAGIVSQSKEKNELDEVNNKLGALKKAIDLAEKIIN